MPCGGWVEGASGYSSAVLKGDILLGFIPHDNMRLAKNYFSTLQKINIEREAWTLQIVNAYVKNEFRGKGIVGKLINEHITNHKKLFPNITKAQLRPTIANESAFKAYNKLGFELVSEKTVADESVLTYLPARGKYLMEKLL